MYCEQCGETMNETHLLRICLSVAVVGILALFFLAETLEAKEIEISEITPEYIGQTVSVFGTISTMTIHEGMTFMTLEDSKELFPVVFFLELSDISSEDEILVSGKVQEYKGRLQIVGEKYSHKGS